MIRVKKNLGEDIEAAQTLGISGEGLRNSLDRLSNIEVNAIINKRFRPITISNDIRAAFRTNAIKLGVPDPMETAFPIIADLRSQMLSVLLSEVSFPRIDNPLQPIMQNTPLGPTTLNLPGIDAGAVNNQVQGGNFNNLTTQQKLGILFPND